MAAKLGIINETHQKEKSALFLGYICNLL